MTTSTGICNKALLSIGARSTIASLTEESNEAEKCRLLYNDTRDEVLQKAFWNFAKKTAVLGELKSAPGTPSNPTGATEWSDDFPAPPWLYEYGYPSDCLQMRYIIPQVQTGVVGVPLTSNGGGAYPYVLGPAARFEIASDIVDSVQRTVVLTNQYQAIGCYTLRVTNENLFSSSFVDAFAAVLGARLAMALTGDKELAKLQFSLANQYVIEARASDGNEGLTIIDPTAEWILARDSAGIQGADGYWVAPYSSLYLTS